MKVESWDDLFKYNNELINDDYNHGQALVIKTKAKASDNVTVSRQRRLLQKTSWNFYISELASDSSWFLN